MERADFYVLAGSNSRDRWKFACQQVEQAFLAEERVLVWFNSADDMASFDDLLWTFAD
ncbi:MAG: DNA polymerase III subunit chi, partial [Proteobacteria bacterium]|nr:DNA polymerase III subunit chi [Pseudomonadota bacterium]